ncbi:hypothetical protein IGI04_042449 [Brassica rapa subsp. trilocularis]|uniref:Uncharacterized protein n=1 Tax=Brassica rapa subsp. trilocularis TaxID=1813537 RepID=A0ABQ7KL50_BRACM|nr:hypothetical protein IGI04_042449 [Brassica rapa subsp. trilocularis]
MLGNLALAFQLVPACLKLSSLDQTLSKPSLFIQTPPGVFHSPNGCKVTSQVFYLSYHSNNKVTVVLPAHFHLTELHSLLHVSPPDHADLNPLGYAPAPLIQIHSPSHDQEELFLQLLQLD